MVILFGQKVYSAKGESFESGNEQEIRNCLNPLVKDIDLQLQANHESLECRGFHGVSCSQDTIDLSFPLRIKTSCTNGFGHISKKVIVSGGSVLLDLNKTPVNEESGLDGFTPISLDDIHEKDDVASPASCCTAEFNSRNEEDSCDVIQMAAECLVYISTVSLDVSQDFPLKPGSRTKCSYQEQDFLNKPEIGIEEPGCSCDSYELHTLGIREAIPEDVYCVSSKAIDGFNNKEELGGVKLRRGRRMKNFKKEILPGLVPLSRHEIHEDLNILEAVLRSREYKKTQGRTRDGKSRNNYSIQRYVGRRSRRVR